MTTLNKLALNKLAIDEEQKIITAKEIKDFYEKNGLRVEKVIKSKLNDGFYVYHEFGMCHKAYKRHKTVFESGNVKIVETQPYIIHSDFVCASYPKDSLQINVLEARHRAGIKGNFIRMGGNE